MTKLKELIQILENGMIGEFDDGTLGIYIQGKFITTYGGFPLKCFNKFGKCFNQRLTKVYRLKEYSYQSNMNFWLNDKYFLEHIEKTVWENKKEVLSFKIFIEENGLNWEIFLENCKIENQRWNDISSYYTCIKDLKTKNPEKWLTSAFQWKYALQKEYSFYITLSTIWDREIEKAQINDIKIIWE